MTSLADRAILVTIHRRRWSAQKRDKTMSEELSVNNGITDPKMARAYKSLIARENTELKTISKIMADAYNDHRRLTLAWGDGEERILASSGYFGYVNVMSDHVSALAVAVPAFVDRYDTLRDEAKNLLNGAWRIEDYPPAFRISERFGLSYHVRGLTDPDDFRVMPGIDESERQRIIAENRIELEATVRETYTEIGQRIRNVLVGYDAGKTHITGLIEKLRDYTGERSGKFNDSIIGNVKELADLLPSLNIAGAPEIDAIIAQLRTDICTLDPSELRGSVTVRNTAIERANAVMSAMNSII